MFPLPLFQAFDYLAPAGMALAPGDFVVAPFGPREALGVVWKEGEGDDVDPAKLKTVAEKLAAPPLGRETIDFLEWVARYTMFPLGSVLRLA
ncbi:MAG TPA: primosomal protein N', partial [Parvularculaceae bacterium]|nr:primosomal protein N' [Parvularculaceae bacterium]